MHPCVLIASMPNEIVGRLDAISNHFSQYFDDGTPIDANPKNYIILKPPHKKGDVLAPSNNVTKEYENGPKTQGNEHGTIKWGRTSPSKTSFSIFFQTDTNIPYEEGRYEEKFPPCLRADICLHFHDVSAAENFLNHDPIGSRLRDYYKNIVVIALSNPLNLGAYTVAGLDPDNTYHKELLNTHYRSLG